MKRITFKYNQDNRGWLKSNTYKKILTNSQHFFISLTNPEIIRGNHYHLKKNEWFVIVKGKCKIYMENINTKKKQTYIVKDSDNIAINIGPNMAHAFKNIGKNEMIILAFVNKQFDITKPDTYEYKII